MFTLDQEIEEICESHAGINLIYVTDPTNLTETNLNPPSGGGPGTPTPVQPPEIYKIWFRKYTAQYKEKSGTGPGGDYEEKELTFLLPKKRASVEHFKRQVLNRHIAAFAYNPNGDQHTFAWAKVTWVYDSNKRLGEDEAYEFKISCVDLLKDYVTLPANQDPVGTDEPIPGDTEITTTTPVGNGTTTTVYGDCCITVNHVVLGYVPPPTGNTTIKNQIVVGSDLNKYIIDKEGVSMKVGSGIAKAVFTTGHTFSLPSYWDIADFNTDILVYRNGQIQNKVTTLTDIGQYTGSGDTLNISPDWALDSGEFLTVIKIN